MRFTIIDGNNRQKKKECIEEYFQKIEIFMAIIGLNKFFKKNTAKRHIK
jgi:hypothetical protein